MKELNVPASMDFWKPVYDWLSAVILPWGCKEQTMRQIGIAVEELFTNIASYAYERDGKRETEGNEEAGGLRELPSSKRRILVEAQVGGSPPKVSVRLTDWGAPFDPFQRKDPDFQIPFDERPVGGLGIYMVKQFMDNVKYERLDGCNRITVEKNL